MKGTRLVRATLLGFVLFLLLGTSLGFATASTEREETPSMPMPRPGDVAYYSVAEDIVDSSLARPSGISFREFRVEWLPAQWILNADHRPVLVHPVQYHLVHGDTTYTRQATFDASSGEGVTNTHWGSLPSSLSSPVGAVWAGSSYDQSFRYENYDVMKGLCGIRAPFAGGPIPTEGLTWLDGHCDWYGGEKRMQFVPVSQETIQRRDAVRFDAVLDPEIKVWYAEDLPVPVRIRAALSELMYFEWNRGRIWDLRLESFTQGSGEYGTPSGPVPLPDLGPVTLAERTESIVNEQGVARPFTIADAYTFAKQAEIQEEDSLQEFLANHPNAYLGEAVTFETVDDQGGLHRYVNMIVTDGTDWIGRTVVNRPFGFYGLLHAPPVAEAALGRVVEAYAWNPSYMEDGSVRFPPSQLLPDRVPLMADVIARYAANLGVAPTEDMNYWGFSLRCANQGCSEIDPRFIGGQHHSNDRVLGSIPSVSSLAQGEEQVTSFLIVGASGRTRTLGLMVFSSEGPLPLGGGSGDNLPAPVQASTANGPWAVPPVEAVAGMGFLAALIAALYYFWPAIKAAPLFSLFSRTRTETLLEHPLRARLHTLIQENPGIHFQALSRHVQSGRGTLEHHLRKLHDSGLIIAQVGPGYTCYFAKGQVDRKVMAALPYLKAPSAKRLLEALMAAGPASTGDLATRAAISPGTASHHLDRMRQAGLIEGGGRQGYRVTPLGESVAATV